MLIRTLTEARGQTPELIPAEVGEPELYFRKGEVFEPKSAATEYPLAVGVPNPHFDPRPTPAEDFAQPDHSGVRIFDFRLGCYVKAPRREAPVMRRPRPSPKAWTDTSGDHFWIMDRETGARMVRIRAQTAANAQTYAGIYALAHKLPASAAYALRDQ